MPKSRRKFIANASLALAGAAAGCRSQKQPAAELPPGAPPAFGTAPPVGPEGSPNTFDEAEKLVQVEMTGADRVTAASNWRTSMAALYERRTGPRKVALEPELAPYSQVNPVLPGQKAGPDRDRFVRSTAEPGPAPASDDDLAYAPVTQLARWIEQREVTSERLTNAYFERIQRLHPNLPCATTLPPDPT